MTDRIKAAAFCAVLLAWAIALAACGAGPGRSPAVTASAEPFVPGLGEIMSLQQMRHVKLWFAGQAGNWKLAAYEVDELGEGFDDVVKLHPVHKDAPLAPKDLIPRMIPGPLTRLGKAIETRDSAEFLAAYDALTEACNGCQNFEPVRR